MRLWAKIAIALAAGVLVNVLIALFFARRLSLSNTAAAWMPGQPRPARVEVKNPPPWLLPTTAGEPAEFAYIESRSSGADQLECRSLTPTPMKRYYRWRAGWPLRSFQGTATGDDAVGRWLIFDGACVAPQWLMPTVTSASGKSPGCADSFEAPAPRQRLPSRLQIASGRVRLPLGE
jgi:hypothetical protein